MSTVKELTIHPELRDNMDPLTADEKRTLRELLIEHGCRNPIITWANHDDTIVDGHHRYEICAELDISFKIKAVPFPSLEAAKVFQLREQLGRRNATQERIRYMRGDAYNSRKKAVGGNRNPDGRTGKESSGNDCHLIKTAEIVATEYGVSEKTIRNDAKFAAEVDSLKPAQRKAVLVGSRVSLPTGNGQESQAAEVLAVLKEGPATKARLVVITPGISSPINKLKKEGKNIVFENGLYHLRPGDPKKKSPRIPKGMRYEKPEGTEAAIKRMKEIVRKCKEIAKRDAYQANHRRLCNFIIEISEIVECFSAGKK